MIVGRKKYRFIILIGISLLLAGLISFAQAAEVSQIQWAQGITSGKLQRGDNITYMGYTVEVVTFPGPVRSDKYFEDPDELVEAFVGLNISKNGEFINTTVLREGEQYITPDEDMRIIAKQLPSQNDSLWRFETYGPWAILELNQRGIPKLEVSIKTDREEYTSLSGADIVAVVTLKNTGLADLFDADMNLKTELQSKRGSTRYHYERIKIGETLTETITFSLPTVAEKKSYTILANVSGYDVSDLPYSGKFLKTISILPESQVIPSIKKSVNDKMYLTDYTMVTISIKNYGKYDLNNVSITDSLPGSFKLLNNNSLRWKVNIPANGDLDIRYLIKPLISNKEGIILPPATMEYSLKKEYRSIKSNQAKVIVYGPGIQLTKQTNVSEINPGDAVAVTIVAENIGSAPTKINITDYLPKDVTIISGNTAFEEYLEASKKVSFSYIIKTDSKQTIVLPPVRADYYELGTRGAKISTMSEGLEIKIKSPEETPAASSEEPPPIESPNNSEYSGAVNESDEPVSDAPGINESISDEPTSNESSGEGNMFLNLLLGCDENNNISFYDTHGACRYFIQ